LKKIKNNLALIEQIIKNANALGESEYDLKVQGIAQKNKKQLL